MGEVQISDSQYKQNDSKMLHSVIQLMVHEMTVHLPSSNHRMAYCFVIFS